jgi:hypothetical protein
MFPDVTNLPSVVLKFNRKERKEVRKGCKENPLILVFSLLFSSSQAPKLSNSRKRSYVVPLKIRSLIK